MWSSTEFSVALSEIHGRNVSSLIRAAGLVCERVGFSFSKALGNTFRQAVAGIFAKKEMNTDKMLQGHVQATVARCRASASQVLAVSQDTTYYNLHSHHHLSGLGLIHSRLRGTLQHNALAMDGAGTPLGLVYQRNWTRGGAGALARESDKWEEGLKAVNAALGGIGKPVVLVQDREADVFAFFCAKRSSNVELVVRVCQPRRIEVAENGEVLPLHQAAELLTEQGETEVQVRRKNRPVRLRLQVKAGEVAVLPPKGTGQQRARGLQLVVAREIAATDEQGNDAFDAGQAACWLLLTTCQVQDAAAAFQVVAWYALRWRIEQLHYVLKSGGLKVEKLQFDDVHTFFNALAFYSVVAWRVLCLTYRVRQEPQAPVEEYLEPVEVKLLQASSQKPVRTLQEAVLALGRLVNFHKTRKQPLPGAKLLAEALVKLHYMVAGWKLFEQQQNNTNFFLQD